MAYSSREWRKIDPHNQDILKRHMSNIPVKLGDIARDLGVEVKISSLPLNISGQIEKSGNSYRITINRHESKQRQRFTLAHEISHFLLHKDMVDRLGGALKDNVLYRSGAPEVIEYEANRLAAQIVMPEEALSDIYGTYGMNLSESALQEVAEKFGVSKAAMEIRVAA